MQVVQTIGDAAQDRCLGTLPGSAGAQPRQEPAKPAERGADRLPSQPRHPEASRRGRRTHLLKYQSRFSSAQSSSCSLLAADPSVGREQGRIRDTTRRACSGSPSSRGWSSPSISRTGSKPRVRIPTPVVLRPRWFDDLEFEALVEERQANLLRERDLRGPVELDASGRHPVSAIRGLLRTLLRLAASGRRSGTGRDPARHRACFGDGVRRDRLDEAFAIRRRGIPSAIAARRRAGRSPRR